MDRRLSAIFLGIFLVLTVVPHTISQNVSTGFDISSILPLLQSPAIASQNVSSVLKQFPLISSQNISQLLSMVVPKDQASGINMALKLVPDMASMNLIQVLQYFPHIASMNVSQLSQMIPDLTSNTTALLQFVNKNLAPLSGTLGIDINKALPLLQSGKFESATLSQLLQIFPVISSQNISQLVKIFAGQDPGIQSLFQFAPQLATTNVGQLLQYLPDLAAQNISQLTQTVPLIMSNQTELMQLVGQIIAGLQKHPNNTATPHEALNSLQSIMNIPQTLMSAIKGFKITEQMLYALGAALKNQGVGERCMNHVIGTVVGLNYSQMWAYQMLDAVGKPPAYLRSFTFNWLGDYQECKDVDATIWNGDYFNGRYCTVQIDAPAALVRALVPEAAYSSPKFTVGTCFSDACSKSDVRGVMATVYGLVSGQSTYTGDVDCKIEDRPLEGGAIAAVVILVLIGTLIVLGTTYDVIKVQLPARRQAREPETNGGVVNTGYVSHGESNGHAAGMNGHVQNGKVNGHVHDSVSDGIVMTSLEPVSDSNGLVKAGKYEMVAQPRKGDERSILARILMAFSAYTNGTKLLNTFQPKGAIECINGIRVLSMAWVILGHTSLFFSGNPENIYPYLLKKIQQWTFYAYYSATVSVDSFFTLSGLLVGYLTLQQLKKSEGAKKMNWFMFYFHRFWRLTPPYMLVLMVLTTLWTKMGHGPMWPDQDNWSQTKFCTKNWWSNLLYINNYYKPDEMCMGWSWYLADDMMYYILSPLIIVPFYYNVYLGAASASVFFLATTITAGVITKKHEYTALFLSFIGPKPKDGNYMKIFYFPAHTRMGPYIVGLVAGYIMYRYKDAIREKMSKIVAVIGWFLCFTIIALVIYGVYPDHNEHFLTVDQSVAYVALHRSAWAVAICWIIIACYTGYGGWINEILSFKAFVPLGRLTYCAYLVHPIVINVYYMARERLLYFTDNEIAWLFSANVSLSFGVAFLTSLAFESPMMGLEKVIFNKDKKK